MARSIWNGSISFGLVFIPIKVYTATVDKEIGFNSLDEKGHPIQYKKWCPTENREVKWEELKKGYKLTKDQYVVIEKGDIEKLRLKTTKAIEIQEFTDSHLIDPIYVQKSYYVVPEEVGLKAYSLFVEALRLSGKVAIGKVVMRDKEYLVAVRAFKKGLVMHTLHYTGEIKPIEELNEIKNLLTVKEEELKLAELLIHRLTQSEFDIGKFHDAYTEELKRLIRAKAEGKEIIVKSATETEQAKGLMEALKASVEITDKKKKKVTA